MKNNFRFYEKPNLTGLSEGFIILDALDENYKG